MKLLSVGVQFLVQLMLARVLGIREYGVYAFVWAMLNILSIFGSLGFEVSAIRYVSDYLAHAQWSLMRGFIVFSIATVLSLSVAVALVSACALGAVKTFVSGHAGTVSAMSIGLVTLPGLALKELLSGILRGAGGVTESLTSRYLLYPVGLLIVVPLISSISGGVTSQTVLLLSAPILICVLAIQLILGSRLVPQLGSVHSTFSARKWLRESAPIMVSSGIAQLSQRLDVLASGLFLGATAAGLIALASRLAMLVGMGLQVSNQATAHMISREYVLGNRAAMQRLVTLTALLAFLSTFPFLMVLLLVPNWVLSWFGHDFLGSGAVVLQLLVMGQFVNAVAGPNAAVMYMTGLQDDMFWIYLGTLTAQIGVLVLLVPPLGVVGVAAASSIAILVRNILTTRRVRYRIEVSTPIYSIFRRDSS